MRTRLVLLLSALVVSACDTSVPDYTRPADYAYTLTVSCYCVRPGPLRITVDGDEVVDIRRIEADDSDDVYQAFIDRWSLTLDALTAYVEQARREADRVDAEFDPALGFPTDVSIDWIEEAADDEIAFTVRDVDVR